MAEGAIKSPDWNIFVFARDGEYSELKNALLYADNVYWASRESPYNADGIIKVDEQKRSLLPVEVQKEYDELANCPLVRPGIEVNQIPHPDHPVYYMAHPTKALRDSKCVVDRLRRRPHSAKHWSPYAAAGQIQLAVLHLLLPDISSLPISAILEMRDRTKDVLDPMRAELLRFTEDLRNTLGDSQYDQTLVMHEANNLVATKIEPVVREAAHRTKELAEQKWRKVYTSVAKAFGFAGAAWIDPKLLGKAVQQTLEAGALTLSDAEDKAHTAKMTAQFVLRARSVLLKK